MSRKSKSEIDARTPDAFLSFSDKALKWIEDNWAPVGGVFGVLIVAGLGWVGYSQWQGYTERKAAVAIYEVEAKIRDKRDAFAREEDKRLQELSNALDSKDKNKTLPDLSPRKIDFDSNFADLARELEKRILDHKNTNAAAVASLNLAGLYLSNKKAELADAFLSKIERAKDPSLTALLKMQKAIIAMELGDFPRATAGFESLISDRKSEFLHPDALLKLGVCQEKQGQVEDAKGTFERVSTEYADSEAGRSAKAYLRLLQLEAPAKTESKG
jgi:predicted negative regulator of RcsB-dependent stress response